MLFIFNTYLDLKFCAFLPIICCFLEDIILIVYVHENEQAIHHTFCCNYPIFGVHFYWCSTAPAKLINYCQQIVFHSHNTAINTLSIIWRKFNFLVFVKCTKQTILVDFSQGFLEIHVEIIILKPQSKIISAYFHSWKIMIYT